MATDIIARGMAGALGSLSFIKLTQAEYDALVKYEEDKVYYAVDDRGKVKQYLGSAELSSGSMPMQTAVCMTATPTGTIAHAERPTQIIDLTTLTWEQGSLRDDTAEEYDHAGRIRTADYIDLDSAIISDIAVSATDTNGSNFLICLVLFDENKKDIADIYWLNSGAQTAVPIDTKYLRILLKRSDGSNITPDTFGAGELKEFLL